MTARLFNLVRRQDVTGISGTGIVAQGVQFSDGTVVLRWLTAGTARPDHVRPTTVIHEDVESVVGLHGHNGATQVEWVDEIDKRSLETAVDGFCPACGERALYRSPGGRLWCDACDESDAAHQLLADGEVEHRVQVGTVGWTIRHPLRERLGDALVLCDLNQHMRSCTSGVAPEPGEYRAVRDDGWSLERVS